MAKHSELGAALILVSTCDRLSLEIMEKYTLVLRKKRYVDKGPDTQIRHQFLECEAVLGFTTADLKLNRSAPSTKGPSHERADPDCAYLTILYFSVPLGDGGCSFHQASSYIRGSVQFSISSAFIHTISLCIHKRAGRCSGSLRDNNHFVVDTIKASGACVCVCIHQMKGLQC